MMNTLTTTATPISSSSSSLDDNHLPRYDLFTKTQQAILGYTPLCTAPLSILGTITVIRTIWKKKRNHKEQEEHEDNQQHDDNEQQQQQQQQVPINAYDRLMLASSILSLFYSFGLITLGPWAIPDHISFVVGAQGNWTTCNVSGFLLNFLFGTMTYSLFLAIYFLLLVKQDFRYKTKISYCLEPIAHLSAINITIINGIASWVEGEFNPIYILPGYCWSATYPPECSNTILSTPTNSNHQDAGVPCIRGGNYDTIGIVAVGICWIGIFLCMIGLIHNEKKMELRLNQFTSASTTNHHDHDDTNEDTTLIKTRQTTILALQYIGAFTLVFTPIGVLMLSSTYPQSTKQNQWYYFIFGLWIKFISPLQGFFHAIIYLHPRSTHITNRGWVESLYQTEEILHAMGGQVVQPNSTNTHLLSSSTTPPPPLVSPLDATLVPPVDSVSPSELIRTITISPTVSSSDERRTPSAHDRE